MNASHPRTLHPGCNLLLTDLYQLKMLQASRDAGMAGIAVFEFFVRKLPPQRGFLLAAGLERVLIFASGGLDENILQRYTDEAVPIDGYGIGTSLTTSQDAPALDCAYKIQEYDRRAKGKHSEGKATWPGRKQVSRRHGADGKMAGDLLTLEGEAADGEPLIEPLMRAGRRIGALPSLDETREHAARQLASLPSHLRRLQREPPYRAEVADALKVLAAEVDRDIAAAAAR